MQYKTNKETPQCNLQPVTENMRMRKHWLSVWYDISYFYSVLIAAKHLLYKWAVLFSTSINSWRNFLNTADTRCATWTWAVARFMGKAMEGRRRKVEEEGRKEVKRSGTGSFTSAVISQSQCWWFVCYSGSAGRWCGSELPAGEVSCGETHGRRGELPRVLWVDPRCRHIISGHTTSEWRQWQLQIHAITSQLIYMCESDLCCLFCSSSSTHLFHVVLGVKKAFQTLSQQFLEALVDCFEPVSYTHLTLPTIYSV